MSEFEERDEPEDRDIPDWDDEYLDRVSDRLMFNYDLEKDVRVDGEAFDLHGRLVMESQKQFLHPSINFANHEAREHVLARRVDRVDRRELDRLVDLGHDLADEWIEPDAEHYGTDFTFAVVASEIPEDVRSFVEGFADRTLIRYGYHGHYEINLVVVAPDARDVAASANADVAQAFALWDDVDPSPGRPGLVARLVGRLRG